MAENNTIGDRIEQLIIHFYGNERGNKSRFAKDMDVNLNNVTNWIGRNDGVGKNVINRIIDRFPSVNKNWLLVGVGTMLNDENKSQDAERSGTPKDERRNATAQADLVPLIPISAHGGSLDGFTSGVMPYECEMVTSPIKGADMAINVTGESMAPEYPNGCIVFAKRIYEAKFIEWGRVYVLDTVNGVVIKVLTPSDKENCVKCVSINKDPIYAPFEVNLEDVNGIYRVLLEMDMK